MQRRWGQVEYKHVPHDHSGSATKRQHQSIQPTAHTNCPVNQIHNAHMGPPKNQCCCCGCCTQHGHCTHIATNSYNQHKRQHIGANTTHPSFPGVAVYTSAQLERARLLLCCGSTAGVVRAASRRQSRAPKTYAALLIATKSCCCTGWSTSPASSGLPCRKVIPHTGFRTARHVAHVLAGRAGLCCPQDHC
jgi:hypothetical protein